MPTISFQVANPKTHRDALVDLNTEYLTWIYAQLSKTTGESVNTMLEMPIVDYVTSVLDKVCGELPPRGVFYVVEVDGAPAGMGGLRWVQPGVAELKRIYVSPPVRRLNIGRSILERLLGDAKTFGYQHLVLDTAPFMHSAQRLYETYGFTDRGPYQGLEVPEQFRALWRFMERAV